tara:strand:+ start:1570 stop:1896 length:327 start_codon:yes stop_codon:yes gene_type:complete
MILKKLSKSALKNRLIKLMDDVKVHLNNEQDVDKFLDETNLFDDWELALPEHEYPILVMAVLNDIRKDNIINSIVDSVYEEMIPPKNEPPSKLNFKKKKVYDGEHPFN